MPSFRIDFEWRRDSKGFKLLPAEPGKGSTSLSEIGRSERLVPNGNKFSTYRPLAAFPDLYARFAAIRSAAELLRFVNKFGPLTSWGFEPEQGDDVPDLLKTAAEMRQVIAATKEDWAKAYARGGTALELGTMTPSLVFDPKTGLRLALSPRSLRYALWLQLGQDLEAGRSVRRCRECDRSFRVGVGTGRRLVADFCSDKHRIAYNNSRRRSRMEELR